MRWSSHFYFNEPPVASEFSTLVQTSGSSGSASFAPFSSLTRVLHLYFVPRGTSQHFLWLAHFLSKFCWTTDAWPTFGAPPTRRGQTVFASKIILFSLCEIIVWQKIGSEAQRKCYMSGVWCEQATYSYAITISHLQTATGTRPLEGLVWFDLK